MDFSIVIKNEINKKKIKKTYVRLFENKFGKVRKPSRPSEMVMLCYNTLLPGEWLCYVITHHDQAKWLSSVITHYCQAKWLCYVIILHNQVIKNNLTFLLYIGICIHLHSVN